ncbi:Crp/Fnr family transcriptional regulator [Kibdelosporangium philippinense]|uniref:Crp/Fnr family transcriptional regulator n=1 Tax=Kibdelosporangium philippinense TaxID=211113 RepID=A0ABS8Z831_9PSEU|nr:Crp/Fnr family transcriptional regulator [Kibdelosporangium philippinense]MCE7003178.1 Crp/Fnr family transcriptional regulator [Kibdelosporangium philippinense]
MHEHAIEHLRRAGQRRQFDREDRLMTIGAASQDVLLIESGVVKVSLSAGDGSELIVDLYGQGELIGELGVMSGRPRSASVVGHISGVAVRVPGVRFRELARQHADVLLMVNETLDRRLRNADHRQLAMASREVPNRVAYQLVIWAKEHGEQTADGLRVRGITQRELAQTVNASEKSVDAALQLLRSDHLVQTGRLWYLLPDVRRLEEKLDQPSWKPGR